MPVHATYDVLTDRPHHVESSFELAAHRIMANWLDTRSVTVTPEDLQLATQFLQRTGATVEQISRFEFRVSERGRSTVLSREDAVMTAIRSLVALDAQRTTRAVARAA